MDEFMEALDDYARANEELSRMQGEYTGHSPSYHLHSWYEAKDAAKTRVTEALDKLIDARVAAVLSAKGGVSQGG